VVDWPVEKREIEVLNVEKSRQYDENAILGIKAEKVKQQGVKEREHWIDKGAGSGVTAID